MWGHRLVMSPEAEFAGSSPERVIGRVLDDVAAPMKRSVGRPPERLTSDGDVAEAATATAGVALVLRAGARAGRVGPGQPRGRGSQNGFPSSPASASSPRLPLSCRCTSVWLAIWAELTVLAVFVSVALLTAFAWTWGKPSYDARVELEELRVRVGDEAIGRLLITNRSRRSLLPTRIELPVGLAVAGFDLPSLANGRRGRGAVRGPHPAAGSHPDRAGPLRPSRPAAADAQGAVLDGAGGAVRTSADDRDRPRTPRAS